jgi:hypothetical protein
MRFSEGMVVQRPMMLRGGPVDAARFRSAPGHQQGEEKKLDAVAHREGQVRGGAARLAVAPVNAQRSSASTKLRSPVMAKMGENRGFWRRRL